MADKTNPTKEITKLRQSIQSLQQEVHTLYQASQATTSSKIVLYLKYLGRGLGVIADFSALLIPAVTIYLAFSNFISIPPTRSLQLNDPLGVPFVIQNNSLINLSDLRLVVKLINVQSKSVSFFNTTYENKNILVLPTLGANSSHTLFFSPPILFGSITDISQADIQLEISYKALFFSRSFTQKFRFVAAPSHDGIYDYFPVQSTN
jgi:hypothetical protein